LAFSDIQPHHIVSLKLCAIDLNLNCTIHSQTVLDTLFNFPAKSLTHLYIKGWLGYTFYEILPKYQWPLLQKLILCLNDRGAAFAIIPKKQKQQIVKEFLARHSGLESLCVRGTLSEWLKTSIPANTTTRLRTLDFDGASFQDGVHGLPDDVKERLWCIPLKFSISSLDHLSGMKFVRFCMFTDPDPKNLAILCKTVPQLERLWFTIVNSTLYRVRIYFPFHCLRLSLNFAFSSWCREREAFQKRYSLSVKETHPSGAVYDPIHGRL